MRNRLFGLIYMSSYKIQLNIVDLKNLSVVEKLDSPSFVQADSKSEVFEEDMAKICTALEGFKEKLKEYGLKNFRFYGNRQLIDDLSASYIADQIKVRTGLKINWLNTSQIVYAKVLSGIRSFSQVKHQSLRRQPIYLLGIGSAMLNLSLFEDGKFVSTWNLPLGPREMGQINEIVNETPNSPTEVMDDYIGARIDHLARQISHVKTNGKAAFVIQHADALNNHYLSNNDSIAQIKLPDFEKFYEKIMQMPENLLMDAYHVEAGVAEHTLPNMVAIQDFVQLLQPRAIYVTDMSVITGLLLQEAYKANLLKHDYGNIRLTFAQNIADRYLTDTNHARAVRQFALHIYDRLKRVHLLPDRARLLLGLAATVCEIGGFINQNERFEQSAEILKSSKLIGLSDRENEIVSEICRYQTVDAGPGKPNVGGHHYRHLDLTMQLEVAKLAAILRLGIALDAAHRQKIKKIVVSLKKDRQLIIHVKTNQDITLERWSFNKNAKLFENVFGIKVSLKQEGMNRR